MKNSIGFLCCLMLLTSCKESPDKTVTGPQATVYFNGDIITMEGDSPQYVEALVVREDTIQYAGEAAEAMSIAGPGHAMKNLNGKTLLPGFIDGHAHFGGFGTQAVAANLLASPDGQVNDIASLVRTLKDWYREHGTDKTQGWILGMGFDDSVLEEKRFPTKADLDQVSEDIPICIIHISGHFCVMNSKGLEVSGINSESRDPTGGIIRRIPGSTEPNGVLEELAAIPVFVPLLMPKDPEGVAYYLDRGQEMALSYGYTTAQDGRVMAANHEQMVAYANSGKLKLDVVSYIDYSASDIMDSPFNQRSYTNRYRIGGLKLTLDGSPQGRTAWRTEPYLIPPEGQAANYLGYPAIPNDEDVQEIVNMAFANNWQLLAHANGDAAIDQFIRTLRPAIEQFGNRDRRNVLIHGQYARFDQIDTLIGMEVIPSLFPMHTFYWGDWHTEIIGPEKAADISPIRYAIEKGAYPTSHTDAPVAFPNLMMILWTTVNRVTRSGKVLGPGQRLTPYQALKTITLWGARQHFEEDRKGSLQPGKLADLVILSHNPLKVAPMELKDIVVFETIKEGVSVYRRED